MDAALMAVAEKLTGDYPGVPAAEVVGTVTACADAWPEAQPLFVENAAQARLSKRTEDGR